MLTEPENSVVLFRGDQRQPEPGGTRATAAAWVVVLWGVAGAASVRERHSKSAICGACHHRRRLRRD